ncbi:MAG: hypothetical protein JO367_02325, partial [Actinobacteria bacterium]|nr:hypothetical protein [Actinomycetota bacterium]
IEAYNLGGADDVTYNAYPTLFTVGMPSINRKVAAVLKGLVKSGYLTAKTKIGVIVEGCPDDLRVYNQTYAPLAKQLGLTVIRRDVDCVNSYSDLGAVAAQISSAVLPFRSAGVDRVSFISAVEQLGILAFSQAAESQGWRPGYALSSSSQVGANQAQLPAPQLPQMVGVGSLPDVDLTSQTKPTAATTSCRAMLTSQGLSPGNQQDFSVSDTACDAFSLLADGLARSRGYTTGSALPTALADLGTAHVSAAVLTGTTSYDRAHHDGAVEFAPFAYAAACSCFNYTTAPAELT